MFLKTWPGKSCRTFAWAVAGWFATLAGPAGAAELTIQDFNGTGMHWTWGDFAWTTGPTSVRIYDPVDSTGGAGRSTPGLNLSALADARWGKFPLSLEARRAKARAVQCFASQLQPPHAAPVVPAHVLSHFDRPYEAFLL